MSVKYDRFTIEPADKEYLKPGETPTKGWWLIGHGVYERSSVLAGQSAWGRIKHYDTKEEAVVNNSEAEVLDYSTRPQPGMGASVSPNAPAGYYGADGGFCDAGEYWGENDY